MSPLTGPSRTHYHLTECACHPSRDSAYSLGIGQVAYQVAHSILLEHPLDAIPLILLNFFVLNFEKKKNCIKKEKKEKKKTLDGKIN
jgi:hypothetical protein